MKPWSERNLQNDNFDTDSSANYDIQRGVTDNEYFFAYDYSALGVPSAPRTTGGTTKGLALHVNLAGTAPNALNAYTKTSFSGNYQVTVDVYGRYVGATGTTQLNIVGINHSGTKITNIWQSGTAGDPANTDGYWFEATCDGGYTNSDYSCLEGNPSGGSPTPLTGLTWGDALTDDNFRANGETFFSSTLFPSTGGNFGNQWVTVKIVFNGGIMSLYFNDQKVWDYDDPDDTYTSGKVCLGQEDDYASINTDDWGIFDNLLVESISTNVEDWSLY